MAKYEKPKVRRKMAILIVGDEEDIFATAKDAKGCAWGPRFSAGYSVATYRLVKVEHFPPQLTRTNTNP